MHTRRVQLSGLGTLNGLSAANFTGRRRCIRIHIRFVSISVAEQKVNV